MTATASGKARVMFVDDEPRVLNTMRMLFRNTYELSFANSGAEALELLRAGPVDVIVSDQRMPGMTGIDLLRSTRDLNPGAMRILLTGYSDLNAIIGSINEGEIFRFVNKPWSNEDLSTTVAQAVRAAHASTAAANGFEMQTPLGAPAASAEHSPGVLVLDDDPDMPGLIQDILGPHICVFGAGDLSRCIDLLEHERIGVLLSETRVGNQPVVSLINTLRRHSPELVSVILTERADAASAIDLINQGQIYRLITKPIVPVNCKIMIASAIKQHQKLACSPELHRRYEVAAAPEPVINSLGTKLLDRIRSLRGFIGLRA